MAVVSVLLLVIGCDALRVGRQAIDLGEAMTEIAHEVRRGMEHYHVKENTVYWGDRPLPSIEASTFEVARTTYGHPLPWGTDGVSATLRGSVIPGADGASFVAHSRCWASDRNHVYFAGTHFTNWEIKHCEMKVRRFPDADVSVLVDLDGDSFRLLKGRQSIRSWFCDDHHVYYGLQRIDHAEPATFRSLSTEKLPLWRDKRYLYRWAERLETSVNGKLHAAVADDFRRIDDSNFFTDGIGVWYGGNLWSPLLDVDAANAVVLDRDHLTDGQSSWKQIRKVN
ncbi:MAG: DKNYY domain-containing protein [Planctomycetota bacterium]